MTSTWITATPQKDIYSKKKNYSVFVTYMIFNLQHIWVNYHLQTITHTQQNPKSGSDPVWMLHRSIRVYSRVRWLDQTDCQRGFNPRTGSLQDERSHATPANAAPTRLTDLDDEMNYFPILFWTVWDLSRDRPNLGVTTLRFTQLTQFGKCVVTGSQNVI